LDDEVVNLELGTGTIALDKGHDSTEFLLSEYERLIRQLQACNMNLIFLDDMLRFELQLGTFITDVVQVFENLRTRAGDAQFHSARSRDGLQQHVDYCINSSQFRKNQIQSLKMRIQSKTNLVSC
jgi:hypothetical protein